VARQSSAKASTAVRICSEPPSPSDLSGFENQTGLIILYMKYSTWVGIIAAVFLTIAGFTSWAYYPDIHQTFTGFFSQENAYGKPGAVLIFFSVISVTLFITPKIWAKRFNMLVASLALAYCIKCYVLFTSCYRGICPDKKIGIFLIIIASALMMIAALLPDLKLKEKKEI
jgi:hypothetical protein